MSGRDFGLRKSNGATTNSPKRNTIHFSKNEQSFGLRFFTSQNLVPDKIPAKCKLRDVMRIFLKVGGGLQVTRF